MKTIVPMLLVVLASGCSLNPTWDGQTEAIQLVTRKLEAKTAERVTAYRAATPCPPGIERAGTNCNGYEFGMVVPAECGGVDQPSNYEWRTIEKSGDVKRMAAQCRMQAQATQQQVIAVGSIQQQMQNALFYNDMTRILGYGIYNMMR